MTDPKRHFQKPLELSPLVAIDRERCILCYRCVRFSQEVAEDEQLQLLERGDRSFVGTFDERPYVAPFHGNIIELCPVGALTSYTYRFRARPWDIEDAGSVCTLCPSQCNVKFTVRDERVLRVLARDNHAVDDGWLCDKGRFAFQMFNSEDRITEPMVRAGDGSLSPISWDDAISKIASKLKGAGENAAALVGGGTSNEEGWLAQRIVRKALGGSAVASSPTTADPALLAELSRPEMSSRMSDLDYAGAIVVIGADPLHEMPILDLRIRKAVRRNGAKLVVASERPTALDGGAVEAIRYAPGGAAGFLDALRSALGGRRRRGRARADMRSRRSVADALKSVPDPVIVWGERLWRSPGAVEALRDVARELDMHQRIGPGLLEVPEESNARGLREVGVLPGAGPGFSEAPAGADGRRDQGEAGEPRARRPAARQQRPGPHPPRRPGLEQGARRHLRRRDLDVRRRVDQARRHRPARRVLRREGGHRHPPRRPPAARATERPAAGGHAPRLVDPDASCSRSWATTSASGPRRRSSRWRATRSRSTARPHTRRSGARGLRWQERDPGTSWTPPSWARFLPHGGSKRQPKTGDGLILGTYRDLWASEVTERNPSLRFLMPTQRLELHPDDAKALASPTATRSPSRPTARRVEAFASVKSRMRRGAAFLIEGTERATTATSSPAASRGGSRWRSGSFPPTRAATGTRTGTAGSRSSRRRCRPAGSRTDDPSPMNLIAEVGFAEASWIMVVKSVIIFLGVFLIVPVLTVVERKLIGRFQNRYGPNRVGPHGLMQPLADIVKLAGKEKFRPDAAVPLLFAIAPAIAIFSGIVTLAIIPFGDVKDGVGFYGIDVSIGVLYFFAFGSLSFYGLLLAGWSSGSKYSFLGAMRSAAQLISYEVSMGLSLIGVVMMAGSLSLPSIVEAQGDIWYIVPQFVGFLIFMVSGFAETNRAPFDLPEADAELVQGYHDRVRRDALRLLPAGRVPGDVRRLGDRRHLLPRRLDGPRPRLARPDLDGRQGPDADLLLHLGPRHAAPAALRPADEPRLEDHAAARHAQRARHRHPRHGALDERESSTPTGSRS